MINQGEVYLFKAIKSKRIGNNLSTSSNYDGLMGDSKVVESEDSGAMTLLNYSFGILDKLFNLSDARQGGEQIEEPSKSIIPAETSKDKRSLIIGGSVAIFFGGILLIFGLREDRALPKLCGTASTMAGVLVILGNMKRENDS